jgi:hypothetical protein
MVRELSREVLAGCTFVHLMILSLFSSLFSFGYVVEGAEFLGDMDEGDIIIYAKVTEGAQNLILPK